jgi:hypothetical protein
MKGWPRKGRPPRFRPALAILALPSLACAAQPAATPPSQGLADCAGITDSAARLACYDRLAGRGAAPAAPEAPAAPAQPAGTQASAATSPSAGMATPPAPPVPVTAPAPASAAAAAAGAARTPPGAAAPPPPSPQSFGLYQAEHPKPPPVSRTLEARVVALGKSAGGQMTVTLDGGAMWELLDDGDPLLAVGDAVTIQRAALGSYLMSTPTKRIHRVYRLE